MNKQKGFTIIELIVVIAIIAVLAAIVLVNVTQYIAKGKNSSIKGNMATILTNSAVWYDQNNSTFTGFTTSAGYTQPLASATGNGATFGTPVANATNFCLTATALNVTNSEPSTTAYCVDSTGNKVQRIGVVCTSGGTCQ